MSTNKLTARQQQIYDFICSEVATKGYPPSVREIAEAVGLKSPSTVHTHLQVLEDKGYIKRDLSKPRALEITAQQHAATDSNPAGTSPSLIRLDALSSKDLMTLPIIGRVAAGQPILAEQNIEDTITLPTSIVGDSASFVLRVKGESMIGAGIFDGDYVVVKEQQDAVNGQIVVALIDDGATVKTFYREKDRIRLQPENPAMSPIYTDNVSILGKVVALVRSL